MDRNLGAIITSYDGHSQKNPSAKPEIIGLYYQYGRKDPFKTQGTVSNTSGPQSYADSVKNPDTFITNFGNWHTPSNDTYPWNGSSNEKSIYDPCPAGWRVPEKELWAGFDYINFIWDLNNKGKIYNSIAWYPFAGSRDFSSSSISDDVGSEGNYWSSSPYESTASDHYLSFTRYGVDFKDFTYCTKGLPVRCVQE